MPLVIIFLNWMKLSLMSLADKPVVPKYVYVVTFVEESAAVEFGGNVLSSKRLNRQGNL
jgi:hypothetical protein